MKPDRGSGLQPGAGWEGPACQAILGRVSTMLPGGQAGEGALCTGLL